MIVMYAIAGLLYVLSAICWVCVGIQFLCILLYCETRRVMKCILGHKYGKVHPCDGYQYCKKCGKARAAPCVHNFAEAATFTVRSPFGELGREWVYKCTKCKEMKKFSNAR